jgi:hypothetical protein
MIHESRGNRLEADRLTDLLLGLVSANIVTSRLGTWLAQLLVLRGEFDLARSVIDSRPPTWRVHATALWEGQCGLIAATEDWQRAPSLLDEMRTHMEIAGTGAAIGPFANKLEGMSILAAGDPVAAVDKLTQASAGFETLRAVWEQARTDIELARALDAAGRQEDAQQRRDDAISIFRRLDDERSLALDRQA